MHKETEREGERGLSCLALHRRRKITSLDCAKVLTNYFRPLETATGIISLPLSPRRLMGVGGGGGGGGYSKHDQPSQKE